MMFEKYRVELNNCQTLRYVEFEKLFGRESNLCLFDGFRSLFGMSERFPEMDINNE